MPDAETPAPDRARSRRRGRVAVVYWLVAGLVYAMLGALYPPVFLLGFQEALIYVFIVTALQPWVVRRFS